MNPWELLGIEPTKDRRAIKRAYARLLQVHRPDGDQAAFERLRRAYEQALAYADPPEKARPLPTVDFTPPGADAQMPELLSAQFHYEAPPAPPPKRDPLLNEEKTRRRERLRRPQQPDATAPPPPEPDEEWVPPELLELEDVPPELGPLLEKARRQQERKRLEQSKNEPVRPLETPRPPRSTRAIVDELVDFAWQHREAPAEMLDYLAEEPDLINLDTKSMVSLELARQLIDDRNLPTGLLPLVVRFFEWDTFTEQRRLGAALKKLDKLRLIVSAAELQQYLDAVPANRRDTDVTRRQLRALRAAGADWRAWLYAWLHPLRNKHIRRALAEGDRRYGSEAVRQVVGPRAVKFWNHALAPRPNPIQGLMLLSRLAWLNAIFVLPILAMTWTLEKENPLLVAVAMVESLVFMATLFFFGRWLLRAGGQLWTHYVWRGIAHGINKAGLMRRERLFTGLLLSLTGAAFFWPLSWSGLYLTPALVALLVLTFTDSSALAGLMLSMLSAIVVLAGHEPPRLHWYVNASLLVALYLQWLSYWLHKWIQRRNPSTRQTAAGLGAMLGAAFMIGAIVILNLTKH